MGEDIFITITGLNFYYGMKPFAIGNIIRLVKEPENDYDPEAIRTEMPFIGRVGYIANSPHTMAQGTYSAGRLYDKMGDAIFARVMFTTQTKVIARVEFDLKVVMEVSVIEDETKSNPGRHQEEDIIGFYQDTKSNCTNV